MSPRVSDTLVVDGHALSWRRLCELRRAQVEAARKGEGESKGRYEVIAGGRRLAALRLLAKKKQMAANARIPCHVLDEESATEISLAENAFQAPMHPADQYEAFAKLNAEGLAAAEIAARFGVTEAVVKQRFKLGGISPKLLNRYRAGEMDLDTLTAFAITDDHKAQERVWNELPEFQRSREAVLDALTETQVRADDRRAGYVGAEAYSFAYRLLRGRKDCLGIAGGAALPGSGGVLRYW